MIVQWVAVDNTMGQFLCVNKRDYTEPGSLTSGELGKFIIN